MGQPFLLGDHYSSHCLKDVGLFFKKDHLLIEMGIPMQVVSSALWGGGFHEHVNRFVNWKVPLDYACADPVTFMGTKLEEWGYGIDRVVGLQTAANLRQASIVEESGDCFHLLGCTTAGISNAARAGRLRKTYSAYSCGTINTFILIDGRMSSAAMVNAIVTATEAKAAALQDLGIRDENGDIASGTTTDSVVVGVTQLGFEEVHLFAGTATTIGNAVGRLVYQSVVEAVSGP
jgi:adenosylcobinamide hydrolase